MSDMLNKYQAIVITGYTGVMMVNFSFFHADVESRMGRPVFVHEFANEKFAEEIKKMYEDEFFHLCNEEKP